METTSKKTLIAQVKQWWRETDFQEMALVTGVRQHEFSPEDGYQEFVDACNERWGQLSSAEKIEIWKIHA